MTRYPFGMPAWLFWLAVALLAGLLAPIPSIGLLLAIAVVAAAIAYFLTAVRPRAARGDSPSADATPSRASRTLGISQTAGLEEVRRGQRWDMTIEVEGEHEHRTEIQRIFERLGYLEGGETYQTARLFVDKRGVVRVEILGELVGYIDDDDPDVTTMVRNSVQRVGTGRVAIIDARVWARNDDGTWRSRATLEHGIGEGRRERNFLAERLRHEQAAAERNARVATKEAEREARDAERAAKQEAEKRAIVAGSVDGAHWTTLKPTVTGLKASGDVEGALALIGRCVDAAEREARERDESPAAWPVTQLCMILRDRDCPTAELAAFERYEAACGHRPLPGRIANHLARLRGTAT